MESNCPGADVPNQHLVANWNSSVSMDQSVHFDEYSRFAAYNVRLTQDQEINSSQLSSFGNERFPETLTSFDFPQVCQLVSASDALDFPLSNQHSFENNFKGKKRKGLLGCDTSTPISSMPDIEQKDVSSESVTGKDEEKQKNPPKPASMIHSNSKPGKAHLQEGNATKEEYIHVRAKRGQATNSHSLAERVRRERISQRMKLLQDLVPGCNKITGKAVMLDEVINYVQSLQCQVEFLSMKLAAVNPSMNFDIEQMLSKDMLRLRDRSSAVAAFASRMPSINNSQFCESSLLRVMQPDTMSSVPDSEKMLRTYLANVPNMSQISNLWDDGLQNVAQMNYMPNVPSTTMEQHGS